MPAVWGRRPTILNIKSPSPPQKHPSSSAVPRIGCGSQSPECRAFPAVRNIRKTAPRRTVSSGCASPPARPNQRHVWDATRSQQLDGTNRAGWELRLIRAQAASLIQEHCPVRSEPDRHAAAFTRPQPPARARQQRRQVSSIPQPTHAVPADSSSRYTRTRRFRRRPATPAP